MKVPAEQQWASFVNASSHAALSTLSITFFFTAYPLVFGGIYGFSFQVEALGYLSFIVGGLVAFVIYVAYLGVRIGPIFAKGSAPVPEQWLDPLLFSTVICPMGIFLFAWTSRSDVHWIAPLFGVAVRTNTHYH